MDLSVIIPCYNAAPTLAEQLRALAAQEFTGSWEVIVVDNGSSDRTIALAKSFSADFPALFVITAPDQRGAAHARNRGARIARGRSLVFCDADDVVAPGHLQAMADALKEHPCVACRFDFRKLNRHWITRCHSEPQAHGIDKGLLGPYAYAGGGSLGVRRMAHDEIGGFDENLPALEDTDYCVRLQRAGYSLQFVPDAVVHVRWRPTVRAAFAQARRWGRSFVGVKARHWPAQDAPDTPVEFAKHLLRIRRVRNRDQLARWIWATGWQLGSIEGWRDLQRRTPTRRKQLAH